MVKSIARGCWDVLATAWQIVKETAPVWLPSFVVAFGALYLSGGAACGR
ncbi:hypothetical protein ACFV16_22290 [Streptomyces massasporeus]